jgi:hypothetical protein
MTTENVPVGPARTFKCKWCQWAQPAWFRDEGGHLRNGGDALVEHCEEEHGREVRALREALGHDKPISDVDGRPVREP